MIGPAAVGLLQLIWKDYFVTEVWQFAMLAGVGCAAGFINVMAGGGTLLTLPAMIYLGLPGPVANGTNRIAVMAQNITAITTFAKKGFSDFKLSLTLGLCTLPGVVAGSLLGVKLEGKAFKLVLAGVMIAVMIVLAAKRRKKAAGNTAEKPDEKTDAKTDADAAAAPISQRRMIIAHALMLVVGFYGGFIQAGVGFIIIAILSRVLRLDLVRVNMHKVFIVGMYGIVALGIYMASGKVVWIPGLCLAVGNSTGAWLGTHLAVKKGERIIRIILFVALIGMAIKLIYDAFTANG